MHTTHPTRAATTPAATTPPPALDLETRLAAIDAAMTLRLEQAAVAHEVRTAHLHTEPVHLDDVVTGCPLTPPPTAQPAPNLYPTPVAALLQRAHHRLTTDGWCTGALTDTDGARCLAGAIRKEAAGDEHLEARGLAVLLDAIRRRFRNAESVPGFNDAFTDPRTPLRMLDEAATLADARGL